MGIVHPGDSNRIFLGPKRGHSMDNGMLVGVNLLLLPSSCFSCLKRKEEKTWTQSNQEIPIGFSWAPNADIQLSMEYQRGSSFSSSYPLVCSFVFPGNKSKSFMSFRCLFSLSDEQRRKVLVNRRVSFLPYLFIISSPSSLLCLFFRNFLLPLLHLMKREESCQ